MLTFTCIVLLKLKELKKKKFKGTVFCVEDKTDKSVKVRIVGSIIEFFTEGILKLRSRGSNLILLAEIRKAWPRNDYREHLSFFGFLSLRFLACFLHF